MIRKGIKFKRAPHLHYREVDPERDFGEGGHPLTKGYVAIVRLSQCKKDAPEGSRYEYTHESIQAGPCIPGLVHSRSNMAYGKWRKRSTGKWFTVRNKPTLNPAQFKAAEAAGDPNPEGWEEQWFDNYWTCPVYWVQGGRVYQGTCHSHTEPRRST